MLFTGFIGPDGNRDVKNYDLIVLQDRKSTTNL